MYKADLSIATGCTVTTDLEMWYQGDWVVIYDVTNAAWKGPCSTATGTGPCAAPHMWIRNLVKTSVSQFTLTLSDWKGADATADITLWPN